MSKIIRILAALVVIGFSSNSTASVWCTMTLSNVSTGGNDNTACWISGQVEQLSGETKTDISICGSGDADANGRNYSLALAALMSGKRVQIYATGLSDCAEIPRYFGNVGKFKVLAN